MQWNNLVDDRLASQLMQLGMKMAFCSKNYLFCFRTEFCLCLFIYFFAQIHVFIINPLATLCDCEYLCKDEHFIVCYIIAT